MKNNYPACEKRVLAYEGSEYTDGVHPYDPGGPTRWGITIADARMYWKPSATPDDVRTMPVEVAEAIYKSKYWDKVRGDDLPSGLDETVFDYGVNSGIGRSGKVLRRLCSLDDSSGVITDAVLGEVAKRDVVSLIVAMNDERLRFLQSLSIWPTYKNGWTRRVNDVKAFSLALHNDQATVIEQPPVSKGRGAVTPSTTTKNVIKTAGTAGPAAATVGFSDWITANPVAAVLVAIAVAAAVGGIIYLINKQNRKRQDAPTPGIIPVPVKVTP